MVILIIFKCALSLILYTIWIQILWFNIVCHLDPDSLLERSFIVINYIFTMRFTHFIPSLSLHCKIISFQLKKKSDHSWTYMKSMQILSELWITSPGQTLNWGKDAFNRWWLTTPKKESCFSFSAARLWMPLTASPAERWKQNAIRLPNLPLMQCLSLELFPVGYLSDGDK